VGGRAGGRVGAAVLSKRRILFIAVQLPVVQHPMQRHGLAAVC
jgi:hypothetical protein